LPALPGPSTGHERATERPFDRTFRAIPVPLCSRHDRASVQPADHTGASAQNNQICVPQSATPVGNDLRQIGGSRNFARARLVTLGERLPGTFPVQCKIQKRSHDPRHP
jgi:hypothetical protein